MTGASAGGDAPAPRAREARFEAPAPGRDLALEVYRLRLGGS